MLGHAVVLEHMQQRRLARVVQAKKQQLPGLLPQSQVAQHAREPIPDEHGGLKLERDSHLVRFARFAMLVHVAVA